ncbi:unnamed protein product [Dovyalis caffra]|uniref:Uncharacterized protein n=1 Tax=Dovyalis caffra TaxID=77055 RepID=A0AAV1SWT8_9ROSI|nr:unnamed protein product [Dovyalis caffra]
MKNQLEESALITMIIAKGEGLPSQIHGRLGLGSHARASLGSVRQALSTKFTRTTRTRTDSRVNTIPTKSRCQNENPRWVLSPLFSFLNFFCLHVQELKRDRK